MCHHRTVQYKNLIFFRNEKCGIILRTHCTFYTEKKKTKQSKLSIANEKFGQCKLDRYMIQSNKEKRNNSNKHNNSIDESLFGITIKPFPFVEFYYKQTFQKLNKKSKK